MGTNAKARPRLIKQIIWIVSAVILLAMVSGFYIWNQTRPSLTAGTFELSSGRVSSTYQFEIRHTCAGRQEGLMFRRKEDFPDNRAMLFLFPEQTIQSFWMVNTLLSLDMVFLDRNFEVVGVLPEVPPLNRSPRAVEKPSQYVVELNAGAAARSGIGVGSRLKISGELPRPEACRKQ